jgi:tetratricopeptide (TPR) repeat protein
MKVQAIPALLLAILSWLSPALRAADADEALTAMAAAKRAAGLKVSMKISGGRAYSVGAFISADGLALLRLDEIGAGEKLTITTPDGAELPLGTILGLFPEEELALVKFKHRPKVWLTLASKEPEIGEKIAVAALCFDDSWKEKVTPVIGPVTAKLSTAGGNLRETIFQHGLSLAAGLTFQQKWSLALSSFAVNASGQLAALYYGTIADYRQKRLQFTSAARLADRVAAMVKEGKAIPWPLPPALNPTDPVKQDPRYYKLALAEQQQDEATGRQLIAQLRRRYPDNPRLDKCWCDPDDSINGRTITSLNDIPPLDAKASAPAKYHRTVVRAAFLQKKGDDAGALREFTAALALVPKDFPDALENLAAFHLQRDRIAEAEPHLRAALALKPDSIKLIEDLELVLTKQNKFEEARKLTDRVYEVERLYRAKY